MNILDTCQEDVFSCFQLPTLSKHFSFELESLEPIQFQRAYSDFPLKNLVSDFYPNKIPDLDYEIFPLLDFTQIFINEEIEQPEIEPLVETPEKNNAIDEGDLYLMGIAQMYDEVFENLEINNENIENPEEREFLFGFNFEHEDLVLNQNNIEENEFFFGFDVVDENQVRRERPPRAPRAPRAPRPQRVQNQVNNAVRLDEPVDYIIEELFLDANIKLPKELAEEMMQFAFYELVEFDPTFIQCKICLAITSDYHDLDCKHRYCVPCFTMFCESLLDSCKILPDELQCPDCEKVFPDAQFFRFLSFEKITKIDELRFKIKGQKLVAENKAVNCPIPDCPGYAYILKDEKITACCKCRCTLCCSCGLSIHPGISCEENKAVNQDETLEKLLLSQNWKRCPTCGVPVEKMDGCQFLYCDSLICKGKNNLCYVCGRFVIEAQHFSHYKTKGPFGDTCNTLDGIPEDIDPNLVVPGADINNGGGEEE